MPLPLLVLAVSLAFFLYWCRKFFLAKCLGIFSVVFFYLISIQATGDFLASTLENQFQTYHKVKDEKVDFVLVLGSSHVSDKNQPISSLLSSNGLKRLVEGIRIYRQNPGSKLLFSGYRFNDEISHAQALKKVAQHFGVPESDMILEGQVKDTQEEATHWVNVAKGKTLVLVTTATHMPRSMYLFEQAIKNQNVKLKVIPAPTDYISHQNTRLTWIDWFPSGLSIYTVERAWHEYLGIVWAYLVS